MGDEGWLMGESLDFGDDAYEEGREGEGNPRWLSRSAAKSVGPTSGKKERNSQFSLGMESFWSLGVIGGVETHLPKKPLICNQINARQALSPAHSRSEDQHHHHKGG